MTDPNPPATGDSPVLEARQAIFRQPGRRDGGAPVSFSLANGGVLILVGDVKSAVLEAIAMAKPPSQGELTLFGESLHKQRPGVGARLRRRMGMIFNDLRLLDDLSAWDNVALAVLATGTAPQQRRADIDEALTWVGLNRHAHLDAGRLSLEGRSRLALARAMINGPDLIIADEPHPSVARLLAGLNRAGVSLVIGAVDADMVEQAHANIARVSPTRADRPQPLTLEPGA